MEGIRHISVLLEETIEGLNLHPGDVVVDGTLGSGGHSLEILKRILPDGLLIVMDVDGEAIERFKRRVSGLSWAKEALELGKVKLFQKNFSEVRSVLDALSLEKVSAIMVDLGFSSDQMDDPERGLSFSKIGPLDMRLDRSSGTLTAAEIVNGYSEKELAELLRVHGEERFATKIAKAIAKERLAHPFSNTKELADLIERTVPRKGVSGKIHPATKTFQALRIEVNREADHLRAFLPQAIESLRSGGRLAVIAFHSGEDRVVKRVFRENARGCICPPDFPVCRCGNQPLVRLVTGRPIVPSDEEIIRNPRARSAKLRIVEKI